ncbi:hypothetical protein C8R43DRAFT_1158031, partial [Mycena crocata]
MVGCFEWRSPAPKCKSKSLDFNKETSADKVRIDAKHNYMWSGTKESESSVEDVETKTLPSLDTIATRIAEAIGHIPLAITLMAADALGRRTETLPTDLFESSTMRSLQSIDRAISRSVDLAKKDPKALTLLAILSMLPAGTTRENLRWWAPNLASAIVTLRATNLIETDGEDLGTSRIFARPIIQSYMFRQGRILSEVHKQVHDACYNFVLEHKSTPDDSAFQGDMEALSKEETNIQSLLMAINVKDPCSKAIDALIAFSRYQLRTKPSILVAQQALDIARASRDDHRVAEVHECLGDICHILDRYDEACQHFEEARRCYKSLPSGPNVRRAAECSMKLAETWMYMGKRSTKIVPLVLEAKDELCHDESDRFSVARGLLGFGFFLWYDVEPGAALEVLFSAKALFEELACPASTSECLFLVARTYACNDKHAEALIVARQALVEADKTGDGDLICRVLLSIGAYLIVLSCYDEASEIIERSLLKSRVLGRPLAIAQSLEELGYNCAAKLDLSGARVAYEEA